MKFRNPFARQTRGETLPDPRTTGVLAGLGRFLNHRTYNVDPLPQAIDQLHATAGWVFNCISMIAQDCAHAEFGIFDKSTGERREEWERVPDSIVQARAGRILEQPNESQNWGELTELTQWQQDLTGEIWLHIVSAVPGKGQALGLQYVSPDWIRRPIRDASSTAIIAWEVKIPGESQTRKLLVADLIPIHYPNPTNPFRGMSPIRQMATTYDLDLYSRAYGADFLKNGAIPTGILTTGGEAIDTKQRREMQANFVDRVRGRSEPVVLSKGATYEAIGSVLDDLAVMDLSRISRDMILATYGVPASRLGLQESGTNRATGIEADRVYHGSAINPRLRRRARALTARLLPRIGFDPARYELRYVEQSIRDQQIVAGISVAALDAGTIMLDEHRAALDLEPLEDDAGQVFKVGAGVSWVEDPATGGFAPFQGLPTQRPPTGGDDEPEADPTSDDPDDPDVERARALVREARALARASAPDNDGNDGKHATRFLTVEELRELRTRLAVAVFTRGQTAEERKALTALRSQFSREQKAVLAAIRAAGSVSGVISRSPDATYDQKLIMTATRGTVDNVLDEFEEQWRVIMSKVSRSGFDVGVAAFEEQTGLGLEFELLDESAADYASENAARFVTQSSETTKDAIRRHVETALREGQSLNELADNIGELYDGWKAQEGRAQTIARTETAGSLNAGQHEHALAFDQANPDITTEKTWLPVDDDRTRDAHRPEAILPKQTIPLRDAWLIGGVPMQRPGDPNGGAANNANDRCTVVYDLTETEAA